MKKSPVKMNSSGKVAPLEYQIIGPLKRQIGLRTEGIVKKDILDLSKVRI